VGLGQAGATLRSLGFSHGGVDVGVVRGVDGGLLVEGVRGALVVFGFGADGALDLGDFRGAVSGVCVDLPLPGTVVEAALALDDIDGSGPSPDAWTTAAGTCDALSTVRWE